VTADRARLGFFAILLGYFAIILDGSVLNVAIPAIRRGLSTPMAGAQWVLNGYTLTLAALLLTAGALGDRVGLRRMLLAGMGLFTVASAACAAAPGLGVLIAARVAQGVGAAALLPATLALIPHLFATAAARARAAVIWVAVGAVAVAVGPLAGGLLIDSLSWRAIFAINLPVGLASAGLAAFSVPETPRHRRAVDHAGQLAAAAALGLLTAGLILSGSAGWASPATLTMLAGGLAAGVVFWQTERRSAHPMLPPSFLRVRERATAVSSAALMGFTFYGTLFVMSLYFQQVRDWSPGMAGVGLLPLTVGSTIGPLLLYRPLAKRYGHPVMLLAGFACAALGTAVLGWLGSATAYPVALSGLLLTGVASTIAFSALTSLLIASTPPEQAGLGSGVQNTTRQSGALIAVAILGSVLNTSSMASRIPAAFIIVGAAEVAGITLAGWNLSGRDHAGRRTQPPEPGPARQSSAACD
jgi:MFS transporter, DHA2 family, methylenomycin A resistance protein